MRSARLIRSPAAGLAARLARWPAGALAIALLSACSTVVPGGPGGSSELAALSVPARDCMVFFNELDRVVDVAGTRDGGEHRLAGFPYIRVDRFTASFRRQAASGEAQYRVWIDRMRSLDAGARGYEIANLPDESFPILHTLSREETGSRVQTCGRLLAAEHALRPSSRQGLPELAAVPDDYSTVKRALGLYALTGVPLAAQERSWQRHTEAVFINRRQAPLSGNVAFQHYSPSDHPPAAAAALAQARAIMAGAPVDALGIPQLDPAAREQLLAAYAPSFEIATGAEYDRFGPLQWIDLEGLVVPGGERYWLDVDPSQPVVYRHFAFTRYGQAVLPQLVYTIWFNERPMQASGDLLGGRLDGLVWRVTLDEQGAPLLYDTIQPSGRFAMFFPTQRMRVRPAPGKDPLVEWAYSPIGEPIEQWVGAPGAALAGVSLRIESQTHQLVGVGLPGATWGEPVARNAPYRMLAADSLRALPLPGRGSHSIFGPDGVVPNTERAARYFFWPMGIASPGSMRQWGRQPTAFIGKRHFDDADLLEKRFERVK